MNVHAGYISPHDEGPCWLRQSSWWMSMLVTSVLITNVLPSACPSRSPLCRPPMSTSSSGPAPGWIQQHAAFPPQQPWRRVGLEDSLQAMARPPYLLPLPTMSSYSKTPLVPGQGRPTERTLDSNINSDQFFKLQSGWTGRSSSWRIYFNQSFGWRYGSVNAGSVASPSGSFAIS